MIEKIKETIKKYPIWCCIFSVVLGFIIYGICVFLSECTKDSILSAVPTAILGAITAYIAYQQHITSKRQKEIEEDKHRLELFEKRFECYKAFLNMSLWSHKLKTSPVSGKETEENEKIESSIKENMDGMISFGEQSRFLFGLEVYDFLVDARLRIFKHLQAIDDVKRYADTVKEQGAPAFGMPPLVQRAAETISETSPELEQIYSKKLPEIMGPYLKTTPYLSKD
ncbi:hypothetical protein [Gluconobacter albidus]|uniref:hypothetical protein n=1 Tax=Gluconobacter albidus TaxID=318683 RepID=UPI001B8C2E8D|nr:hypothetical protein [Gluconobacter albidus]MBS1027192.1 hypothetical protein [Gluconobacter albidus]